MDNYSDQQFIGLRDLTKVNKLNRSITRIAIIVAGAIAISSMIFCYAIYKDSRESSFLLTKNGIHELRRTTVIENRDVEGKQHIIKMYDYFLNLDPNKQAIEKSIDKFLLLGGESLKSNYEVYKENRFYQKLISNNIIMRGHIEEKDIKINTSTYPYLVEANGFQEQIRNSNKVRKTFNIKCEIYNLVSRTDGNPHAMWIENLIITDNTTIDE